MKKKWTYEACLEEAHKYHTRFEFQKKCQSAYNAALKHHWLDDYTWFSRGININGRCDNVYIYFWKEVNTIYIGRTIQPKERDWTHIFGNSCVNRFSKQHNLPIPKMEIVRSNLTIKEGLYLEDLLITLFRNSGKYTVLNTGKTGVDNGAVGNIRTRKWNYKACYIEAKNYKTKKEFEVGNASAYNKAVKNKWIKDYTWFNPIMNKWTREECYKEALKYKTKNELCKGNITVYCKSLKKGWLKDYTWFVNGNKLEGIRKTKWTFEKCQEVCRNFSGRTDFFRGSQSAYSAAREKGWLDIFFPKAKIESNVG